MEKRKKQCIAFAKPATLSYNYFVKYSNISISHTHTQKNPKSGYMWECSQFCNFLYSRDPKAQCPSSSSIKHHPASVINYLLHGKCTLFNLTTGQLCTNCIPSTFSAVPPIPVPMDCLQVSWLSRMTCMVPLTLRPCFLACKMKSISLIILFVPAVYSSLHFSSHFLFILNSVK